MPTEGPLENSLYLLTQGNAEQMHALHGTLRPTSVDAALKLIKGTAQASLDSVANLTVKATAQASGTTPAATLSGPVNARVITFGIPVARDGMGYEQGQQLIATNQQTLTAAQAAATAATDAKNQVGPAAVAAAAPAVAEAAAAKSAAAQSATSAANSLTLAQGAQKAALEIPDGNVSALLDNPTTETRQKLGKVTVRKGEIVLTPEAFDAVPLANGGGSGADSTAAIQAAVNYAKSLRTFTDGTVSRRLHLSAWYKVSSNIVLGADDLTITGEGGGSGMLFLNSGLVIDGTSSTIQRNQLRDVRIRRVTTTGQSHGTAVAVLGGGMNTGNYPCRFSMNSCLIESPVNGSGTNPDKAVALEMRGMFLATLVDVYLRNAATGLVIDVDSQSGNLSGNAVTFLGGEIQAVQNLGRINGALGIAFMGMAWEGASVSGMDVNGTRGLTVVAPYWEANAAYDLRVGNVSSCGGVTVNGGFASVGALTGKPRSIILRRSLGTSITGTYFNAYGAAPVLIDEATAGAVTGDVVSCHNSVASASVTEVAAGTKWSADAETEEVALRAAERTDYVEMGRRFSPYRTLQLKKVSAPHAGDAGLEVSCIAEDGRHVTYVIANSSPGNYRIVASVWEGTTDSVYQPDPAVDTAVDKGAYDFTNAEAVRTGTFVTTGTQYTTQVGATIESPTAFTASGGSMQVTLRTYSDNRGGIWRLSIVDKPELGTFDVSTWNSAAGAKSSTWTIPSVPNGTYKVRATFQGADPANAPTGGTARGWLVFDAGYVVRASIPTPTPVKTTNLKPGYSNPDFAINIRPAAGGTYRFVPWHNEGETVESQVAPPAFYDGTTPIDVAAMAIGDVITLKRSFEIVQRIAGRNTTTGPDLISISTKQRITPDGVQSVEGAIKVLADIQVSDNAYVLMHPLNPTVFDRLVSSWGNPYVIDAAQKAANTRTVLSVESNRATSYAAISAARPDLFAAVRFNDPTASFHIGQAPLTDPMWIEHRNNLIGKLYPRIGYARDTVVPAGTVWRFSGDYWAGRLPGIAYVVAP